MKRKWNYTTSRKIIHGFTLIELLVVIAIIALLLAILMPSLKKVKQLARGVVCNSNLRQWHLCWSLYLGDNENKFTPGRTEATWDGWNIWIEMMEPYYQNEKIFTCPSAVKEEKQPGSLPSTAGSYTGVVNSKWYVVTESTNREFRGSYGYNYWVSNQVKNIYLNLENYWRSDLLLGDRSIIPLFADCMWIGGYPSDGDTPRGNEDPRVWSPQMNRFLENRHNGGLYICFIDGSAKKAGLKEIWTYKWHRQFNTSNKVTNAGYVWPEWVEKAK